MFGAQDGTKNALSLNNKKLNENVNGAKQSRNETRNASKRPDGYFYRASEHQLTVAKSLLFLI